MSDEKKLLHERLITKGWGAVGKMTAADVADEIERSYVPLPVDEKGEPWRIGDKVKNKCGDTGTIVGTDGKGLSWVILDGEHGCNCYALNVEGFERREPDSLDKIIEDMSEYVCDHVMPGSDINKAFLKWIERLDSINNAAD